MVPALGRVGKGEGVLPRPERGFFSVGVTQPLVTSVGAGVMEAQAAVPLPLAPGTQRSEARSQGGRPLPSSECLTTFFPK